MVVVVVVVVEVVVVVVVVMLGMVVVVVAGVVVAWWCAELIPLITPTIVTAIAPIMANISFHDCGCLIGVLKQPPMCLHNMTGG